MSGFVVQPGTAALFVVWIEPVLGDASSERVIVVAPVFGMGEAPLPTGDGDPAQLMFGIPLELSLGMRTGLLLDAVAQAS